MNEACEILQRLIDDKKINGIEAIILMRQMLANNVNWNLNDYITYSGYQGTTALKNNTIGVLTATDCGLTSKSISY